jgi:murein DD-endopeptidase MepM/ murein hydrolase activator NlpD
VAVEHRLPTGQYLTSIYGHLGVKRLVEPGDLVAAGQQIGTIGGKHPLVNGGYDPHLHFGIRDGRVGEPGCTLFVLSLEGQQSEKVQLVALDQQELELELGPIAGELARKKGSLILGTPSGKFAVVFRDDRFFIPAAVLWNYTSRPGCELVGDALSTEGWYDPVAFLRQAGAESNPAAYRKPRTGSRAKEPSSDRR